MLNLSLTYEIDINSVAWELCQEFVTVQDTNRKSSKSTIMLYGFGAATDSALVVSHLCTGFLAFFFSSFLFLRFLLLLRLRRRQLKSVGLTVNTGTNGLPRSGTTLKVAESLGEFQGLGHNALLLLVVADLGVAGEREVLAQRVAFESVIGHDSSQIRVAHEEDAEQIVDLTLVPVGTVEQRGNTGHGRGLVGVGLDSDAGIVAHTQQIVDNLEPLVSGGEIAGGNSANLGELGSSVVCFLRLVTSSAGAETLGRVSSHTLEERKNGNDARRRDVDDKLILPHGELLDVLGHAAHQPRAVAVQVVGLGLVLVGRVDDRGLEHLGVVAGRLPRVLCIGRHGDDIVVGRSAEAARELLIAARLDGRLRGS